MAEAAIHAMKNLFQDDEIEAFLLINAEDAFNTIIREVTLHNISIMCPIISTFMSSCCYCVSVRLFVMGNKVIISREGTTQGDRGLVL